MKKISVLIICILAVAAVAVARMNVTMVAGGVPVVGACAASFIEDDFNRSNNGTVGGSWTAETDTGGLLAISDNSLAFTHSATTAGYVSYTKASVATEGYIRFRFKVSSNAVGGNTTSAYLAMLRDDSNETALYVRGFTNSGGTWTTVYLTFRNDANSATDAGYYALNPSSDTWYWFKIYYKIATDIDTNDGIVKLYISTDGTTFTERISKTDCDFYTYADLKYFRVGNALTSGWTSTSITNYWDDAEWRADDCFN